MISTSVIISTYNNPRALERVIERLQTGSRVPDEILIADDGSTPETKMLVESLAADSRVPILHCWHPDKGFRKNRILNACLSLASGEYVVFLDGDCLPHPRCISDHEALAEPGYFVQGRRAFIPETQVMAVLEGTTSIRSLFWRLRLGGMLKAVRLPVPMVARNREMYGLLGCNLAIWRDDLASINGLDEDYEGWGIGEDSDLGARLYNLGRQRKFVHGRALVYHLNHPELPKDHVAASLARLQQTIDNRKIRCVNGLDRHASRPEQAGP
ncbi:MAG: glycosyltransferase family 2 protein [Myxococcales bacterium]|nr:glycosyltransferase family 2 protein [Myxococcales bacterium]